MEDLHQSILIASVFSQYYANPESQYPVSNSVSYDFRIRENTGVSASNIIN